MSGMFECSMFDKDISSWKFNEDVICNHIFYKNTNFQNKYNDGNQMPNNTKDFINWFEKNRDKIRDINTPKEEVLDFFSFDSNIELNKDS